MFSPSTIFGRSPVAGLFTDNLSGVANPSDLHREGPKRGDALQNRDRIIRTAFEVFGTKGVDASMPDIAAAAGVGSATIYRNFPSKEALVDALVMDCLTNLERMARAAAAESDPWEALVGVVRAVADLQLQNRVLSHFLGGRIAGSSELQAKRNLVYGILDDLVERSKRPGQLRSDFAVSDLRMVMVAIARIASSATPLTRRLVERHVTLILDGLRSPGHLKLPGVPLTIAESQEALDSLRATETPPAFRRGRRSWSA
jgi:AcrR family transcriptional regulator